MNVIDTSGMSREQWLALRRQSIGASDAPVIAGLSKYKSRFALWLEKTGQAEPEEAGEEAWWGTQLEDLINRRLNERDDFAGIQRMQVMVRHPRVSWMTATLDMIEDAQKEQVWEHKAVGINAGKKLEDGNVSTLPDAWILQSHHQMMCAEVEHINFAVFVGHRLNLYRFRVEWSEEIGMGLAQLETEFRRHVEDRTPPAEFDPQDAALLLKHYREIEGPPLELSPTEFGEHVTAYKEAVSEIAYAEAIRDKAKARLLAAMGNAPSAVCGPYLMRRSIVNVKTQEPKPKAAYSYTKFTFTNTESDDV